MHTYMYMYTDTYNIRIGIYDPSFTVLSTPHGVWYSPALQRWASYLLALFLQFEFVSMVCLPTMRPVLILFGSCLDYV